MTVDMRHNAALWRRGDIGLVDMECWVGGEPANGVCRLCGRAVCKLHSKEMPYLTVAYSSPHGLEGLAVEGVLWCGVCRPRPEPVSLDFLEKEPPPHS